MYGLTFFVTGLLCINFKFIKDKSIPLKFEKMCKNIILGIFIVGACDFLYYKKCNTFANILSAIFICWILTIIFFKYNDVISNKFLGAMFLFSSFLCIPSYLFIFQIISNAIILTFIIICVIIYIIYTGNVLDYSTRVNLSYVYYLDDNKNKCFLFDKIDDMWLVSENKDYKKCSNKEKNEFYNKTYKYKNDSKVINNITNRGVIINYIDKINQYSEYFRINDPNIESYFNIIDEYIKNGNDTNNTILSLDNKIRYLEKLVSFKCISHDELKDKTLHPHIDNKDRFYDMLKQM